MSITKEQLLLKNLKQLRLPVISEIWLDTAKTAEKSQWSYGAFLEHLTRCELEGRSTRRIARALRASKLLPGKTLDTLDSKLLPSRIVRMLPRLCEGDFVRRGDNLLLFGLPGRGKTHVACAVGHELIQKGYKVLFVSTNLLVQRLLLAKRELTLEKLLISLDKYDLLILDDLGYVQQSRDEMEVLFTLLAERYERKSVCITSNLVFSQWDKIFKDPMTTAAAIDRIVHHSVILEMTGPSVRSEEAKSRQESS